MDNVIDRTIYPLPKQEQQAKATRRMGLGVTGLANAAEMMGMPYAKEEFMGFAKMCCLCSEMSVTAHHQTWR